MLAVKFRRLDPVIETFKAKLGDALIAVVLFGSHARGEGGSSSDWDLFLIAEALPDNPFDRQLFLRSLLPPMAGPISIVAKTRREFETNFPPLYLDIALDGIVLYDPDGYMKGKLEEIRKITRQAGLRRIRKGPALIWTWETPPPAGWRIDWEGLHGLKGRSAV